MVIRSVTLEHVRNHAKTEMQCSPDVNILSGYNGSGKTSVLEALSFCAIAKSFVPVPDQAVIQHGEALCSATVHAMRDIGVPYTVSVAVRNGVRKKISNSLQTSCTPRDIIGEMPIVALSPDHKGITFGGPAERRAFLNGVMAQSSKHFAGLLFEHRRLLKHRNAVLQMISNGQATINELEVWTQQYISVSAEIVERRYVFLRDFAPRISEIYKSIGSEHENITIAYEPAVIGDAADGVVSAEWVAEQYAAFANLVRSREIARETTMFGPHKDELQMHINGGLVRETASQGQHKSLLIALKIAECELLQERCNERPVVLLDDVFSELDEQRSARVLEEVIRMGMQCFVTTTSGEDVVQLISRKTIDRQTPIHVSLFQVDHGMVALEQELTNSAREAA